MSEDKVKDVLEAVNIALNYMAKKGIVIFEIDSNKFFTGVIIIKAKTGEIAKEVAL